MIWWLLCIQLSTPIKTSGSTFAHRQALGYRNVAAQGIWLMCSHSERSTALLPRDLFCSVQSCEHPSGAQERRRTRTQRSYRRTFRGSEMRCKQRGKPPARCAQAALALSHLQPRLCTQVLSHLPGPVEDHPPQYGPGLCLDACLLQTESMEGHTRYVTSTDYEDSQWGA